MNFRKLQARGFQPPLKLRNTGNILEIKRGTEQESTLLPCLEQYLTDDQRTSGDRYSPLLAEKS